VRPKLKDLLETIFRNVPSGVGRGGKIRLSPSQLQEVLEAGARWGVEKGYGTERDLEYLEEKGCMQAANVEKVSSKALQRGAPQLGSLGAGNHFLEILYVDKIFLPDIAKVFGIKNENQVCVMIHTGSRGFGHQVCTDYLRILETSFRDKIRELPDRELVYAPAKTKECENYFGAMACAANFAWCNRQMIMHWTRESIMKVLGMKREEVGLEVVYDVAHNIGKIEEHKINGEKKKVYVHRKGGTRAFGPESEDIPKSYRSIGQPVLVPGSMGTASYVLVGTEMAKEQTFSSVCHGAGRMLSRHKALKRYRGEGIKSMLAGKGILVRSASWKVLAEEAPGVYKDVDEVVRVCQEAGIAKIVAKLKPIGVCKG
jgi:tRNA-splicing ligase RtcB